REQQLSTHGLIVVRAGLLVARVPIAGPAVALLLYISDAASEHIADQRAAECSLQLLLIQVAEAELDVAVGVERRLARDEMDRTARRVLAPQRSLRTAEHFEALAIEQRQAVKLERALINLVCIHADGAHETARVHADAAQEPTRARGAPAGRIAVEIRHDASDVARRVVQIAMNLAFAH